jgi:spectrin beta
MVNDLTKQLIQNEHPDAQRAVDRQKQLNDHWRELEELANRKRAALNLAHRVSQWYIESQETNTWIREKARLIQSTDELGNDLAGIIQLQRRVGGLERDISAIEDKLNTLREEAAKLETERPEEAAEIKKKVDELEVLWASLKDILKERDDRLHQAGELMRFLQNLDHFQQWLSNTQRAIAAEDISNTLPEAEDVLTQHQQIKTEIAAYAPEYAQMKEFGEQLVEGKDDVQYKMLGEVGILLFYM